jgi:hypothetical protein
MYAVSWAILTTVLLLIVLVIMVKNSRRKLELRKVKWLEEEGICQIGDVPGSKLESWYYKEGGRDISVVVTWADMTNGARIFMDGFAENSSTIPVEDNKLVAARMLKYLGFFMGRDTLKLHHEGFPRPSEELVQQIEDKIKPIGYVRIPQDEDKEITWIKN